MVVEAYAEYTCRESCRRVRVGAGVRHRRPDRRSHLAMARIDGPTACSRGANH